MAFGMMVLIVLCLGVGALTPSAAVTYTCDFESSNLCNQWFQETTDAFNWTRIEGATPDGNTGPLSGYGGRGFYMYAEGDGQEPNAKARLRSLVVGTGWVTLKFWCSLYGQDMGYLKVYKKIGPRSTQVGITIAKQRKRDWLPISWEFYCKQNCSIVFEATRGVGWSSDIAIDQVSIEKIQPKVYEHRAAKRNRDAGAWYCSFNSHNCSEYWRQDTTNDFDWLYSTGKSLTADTGPVSGYKGVGYYMLMDASYYRSGQKARLQSRVIGEGKVLLSFWYCMHGPDVGRLRVLKQVVGKADEVIWSRIGEQSRNREWLNMVLDVVCIRECRLVFEAQHGVFEHGDIAIDEIMVRVSHDWMQPQSEFRDYCDFTSDFCRWTQSNKSGVAWEIWKDASPKANTGPNGDYTSGSGKYALFQDSTERYNKPATLTGPVIRAPYWRKFRFAYHMLQYDHQTSRLCVYTKLEYSGERKLIWQISRDEGITSWRTASLSLTEDEAYVIQIEAVGGDRGYGDIAVDNTDIRMSNPKVADCDFNNTMCQWRQRTDDDFDWLLNSGSTPTAGTGPSDADWYLYTDASYPRVNGDTATIESPALGPLVDKNECVW